MLDTRTATGIPNGPLGPGDGRNSDPNPNNRADTIVNHELKVTDVGGVPTVGVSAVLLNVTAVDPTDDGYLTAYPKLPRGVANPADPIRLFDDESSFLPNYPNSSNLNFVAGDIVPNLVLARVGAGGKIRLEELRRHDERGGRRRGLVRHGYRRWRRLHRHHPHARYSTPATAPAPSAAGSPAATSASSRWPRRPTAPSPVTPPPSCST